MISRIIKKISVLLVFFLFWQISPDPFPVSAALLFDQYLNDTSQIHLYLNDLDMTLRISVKPQGARYGTELTDYTLSSYLNAPWQKTGSAKYIKKIIIEPGVTGIGTYAFKDFTALREVVINAPDCEKIPPSAFENCMQLDAFSVTEENPYYATRDDTLLFNSKSAAYRPDLPLDQSVIYDTVFFYPPGRTDPDYVLPDASGSHQPPPIVHQINQAQYETQRYIQINQIADHAFAKNPYLTTVTLDHIYKDAKFVVGESAFLDCGKLSAFTASKTTVSQLYIQAYAFQNTGPLQLDLRQISQLVTLERQTFLGSRVSGFQSGAATVFIGESAFSGCQNFSSLNLSNARNVDIQSNAFRGTLGLKTFSLADSPLETMVIGTSAFFSSGLEQLDFGGTMVHGQVHSPGKIQLENAAFQNCQNLQSVNLAGVTAVGEKAFFGTALTSTIGHDFLVLPDSIRHLGADAFAQTPDLSLGVLSPAWISPAEAYTAFDDRGDLFLVVQEEQQAQSPFLHTRLLGNSLDYAVATFQEAPIPYAGVPYDGVNECLRIQTVHFGPLDISADIQESFLLKQMGKNLTVRGNAAGENYGEILFRSPQTLKLSPYLRDHGRIPFQIQPYPLTTGAETGAFRLGLHPKQISWTQVTETENNRFQVAYTGEPIQFSAKELYAQWHFLERDFLYADPLPAEFLLSWQAIPGAVLPKSKFPAAGSPVLPAAKSALENLPDLPAASFSEQFQIFRQTAPLNAGEEGSVVITAKQNPDNFSGSFTLSYQVVPADFSALRILHQNNQNIYAYTGEETFPSLSVVNAAGIPLALGRDYRFENCRLQSTGSKVQPKDVGSYLVEVVGIGNYSGSQTAAFHIDSVDLHEIQDYRPLAESYPYTGQDLRPKPVFRLNSGYTLQPGVDYQISYEGLSTIGSTIHYQITGIAPNFTGSMIGSFQVRAVDLSLITVQGLAPEYSYTGKPILPSVSLYYNGTPLIQGLDYRIEYLNHTNPGTATLLIQGMNFYTGELTLPFQIIAFDLAHAEIQKAPSNYPYTGAEIRPLQDLVLSYEGRPLVQNQDYQLLSYQDNLNVGIARMILKGIGTFGGQKIVTFVITPAAIQEANLSGLQAQYPFTGDFVVTPEDLSLQFGNETLTLHQDYQLSFEPLPIHPGIITVTLEGLGNFAGTKTADFAITDSPIAGDLASAQITADPVPYNGGETITQVRVTLDQNTLLPERDYRLQFQNNQNAGTATAIITAIPPYTGTRSVPFSIEPAALSEVLISDPPDCSYTGTELTPSLNLQYNGHTLVQGQDYRLTYYENIQIGTARIVITGLGNYQGQVEKSFVIHSPDWTAFLPLGQTGLSLSTPADALPIYYPQEQRWILPGPGIAKSERTGLSLTLPEQTVISPQGLVQIGDKESIVTLSGGAKLYLPGGSMLSPLPANCYQVTPGPGAGRILIGRKELPLNASVTIDPSVPLGFYTPFDNPFLDIDPNAWYYRDIQYVYENGLMNGTGEGKFRPGETINRGMMATVLYNMEGSPNTDGIPNPFSDVLPGSWYYEKVLWANHNGVARGYSETQFAPGDAITREQMAVMLYQYAKYVKGYDVSPQADLSGFSDVDKVSSWAEAALRWANAAGIINGTSESQLSPKAYANRAQLASLLRNFDTAP